jgi:hypothetical protein
VKATVLFFDRKPAAEKPWTTKLWIYDLRTNKHFTLKENPLKRSDLDDFVACYNPKNRHERNKSERFKSFSYEEVAKRDKLNLDIFWLKDESLEDSANLAEFSSVFGFPRHTQGLGASRRKVAAVCAGRSHPARAGDYFRGKRIPPGLVESGMENGVAPNVPEKNAPIPFTSTLSRCRLTFTKPPTPLNRSVPSRLSKASTTSRFAATRKLAKERGV